MNLEKTSLVKTPVEKNNAAMKAIADNSLEFKATDKDQAEPNVLIQAKENKAVSVKEFKKGSSGYGYGLEITGY